jgi:hypothetical protein
LAIQNSPAISLPISFPIPLSVPDFPGQRNCADYGYLRAKVTNPNPLTNIPNEARAISHVWRVSILFAKSERDPKKQAPPTTQIALEGTVRFAPGEGAEVFGLSNRKSMMNITKNNASASVRNQFCTGRLEELLGLACRRQRLGSRIRRTPLLDAPFNDSPRIRYI